jgi:hypothetical protein
MANSCRLIKQLVVFVFCQTALTVIFSVLRKFIIYRGFMKQSFNYMQVLLDAFATKYNFFF